MKGVSYGDEYKGFLGDFLALEMAWIEGLPRPQNAENEVQELRHDGPDDDDGLLALLV